MTSLKFKELLCVVYSCVLFVSGAFLVGYSIVLSYKVFSYIKFMPSNTIGPFITMILLGFIHIIITWLGLRGPSKEHDFHIIMFIIITVIVILLELSEGIWSLVIRGQIGYESERLLNATFHSLIKSEVFTSEWQKQWEGLENHLHCCGTIGVGSYNERKYVPHTCYNGTITDLNTIPNHPGCIAVFVGYVRSLLLKISLAGFLPAIYQMLGVYLFYNFYKSLKKDRTKRAERRAEAIRQLQQPNNTNVNQQRS